jgi:VWFA-related protein
MRLSPVPLCVLALLAAIPLSCAAAQSQQSQQSQQSNPSTPTIKVTSALVFLDVTVLDKKGNPVVTGLTKDDFTITEDKIPQAIFSFEAPQMHVIGAGAADENASGKAPQTILVLDLLNSSFEDFAYIRYQAQRFLTAQPPKLSSPTELLVVGNESLEVLQSFTRSRADLLDALQRLPAALPYKEMSGSFAWERFGQSLDALDQIALQNRGVPGRKNILWVGHGGPNVYLDTVAFPEKFLDELKQYVHSTTNLLVDARISLFVIYPGLPVRGDVAPLSAMEAGIDITDDPFAGDINFGLFAKETGGKLFYNHNDVDKEMKESQQMGAHYYTLTYQPQNFDPNGKFRLVRVALRNPELRVVTKAGYYAPDAHAPIDPRQQQMIKLAEAVESTIPFDALSVRLSGVVRHPDTGSAEFTVELQSKNLIFEPSEDGQSIARLIVVAASLNQDGDILASRRETVTLVAHSSNPAQLPDVASQFSFLLRVPRKTRRVRLIIQSRDGGRIGSADLDRKTIDAAPETATPRPQLHRRGTDSSSSSYRPT